MGKARSSEEEWESWVADQAGVTRPAHPYAVPRYERLVALYRRMGPRYTWVLRNPGHPNVLQEAVAFLRRVTGWARSFEMAGGDETRLRWNWNTGGGRTWVALSVREAVRLLSARPRLHEAALAHPELLDAVAKAYRSGFQTGYRVALWDEYVGDEPATESMPSCNSAEGIPSFSSADARHEVPAVFRQAFDDTLERPPEDR